MKLNLKFGSIDNHKNGYGLYLLLIVILNVVFQTQSQFKFKCIFVLQSQKTLALLKTLLFYLSRHNLL